MAAGVRRVLPDAECVLLPLADGGEGTLNALRAAAQQPGVTRPIVALGGSAPQ